MSKWGFEEEKTACQQFMELMKKYPPISGAEKPFLMEVIEARVLIEIIEKLGLDKN